MESPQDGWPGREDDRRTSDVLRRFIADFPGDRVSVADLTAALGDRAYGVLLFVFALPNLMPVNLPGVSSVLGVPLILLRSEEHTSELQSLMRISYAVFCLKKQKHLFSPLL